MKNQNELKLNLAPMAGYTDLPFRLLAQENGADITTSEMVSAKGLYYGDKKTHDIYKTASEEKNYGIQIFGSEPDILKEAVQILDQKKESGELDYQFIEFNVGCPAPKIVKNGDGSALLKDYKLLESCIKSLKKELKVPLSVKTRIGFKENKGLEIAKIIENSGADQIVVHPRTREQFYSGISDWKTATEILNQLKIPVTLSGDIISPQKAKEALDLGFNHLMIGREAVNNPTIFNQIKDYINTGTYKEFTVSDKIDIALRHIELTKQFNYNDHMIIALRKQLAAYTKGFNNASLIRNKIFTLTQEDEVVSFLKSLKENNENINNNC